MCTCEICGESFGSKQAVGSHKTQSHKPDNPPWESEDALRELYVEEEKPMPEIADEFDVAMATIRYWMGKHGIERRSKSTACRLRHAENDAPYKNEDVLRKEYVKNERTMNALADDWGCDPKTVGNWLHRFGIETREAKDYNRNERAYYVIQEHGYARWYDYYGKSRGKSVAVHRLLAVAEYGFDAVCEMVVHHENGVKWDNRAKNLSLMTPSEHARAHYEEGDLELEPGGIRDNVEELKNEVEP